MEVLSAPFSGILASVTIEDTEEALTVHTTKVVDKSMCILHRPSPSLVGILGNADSEWEPRIRGRVRAVQRTVFAGLRHVWMLVQDLHGRARPLRVVM